MVGRERCAACVRGWCRNGGGNENSREESLEEKLHLWRPPPSKIFEQADHRDAELLIKTMQLRRMYQAIRTLFIYPEQADRDAATSQKLTLGFHVANPNVRPDSSTTNRRPTLYASANPLRMRQRLSPIPNPPTRALSYVSRGS